MIKYRVYKSFDCYYIAMENITLAVNEIKRNKKYSSISEDVVVGEIESYLKSNPNAKIDKFFIKEIRKKLHKIYSSYQTNKKRKKYYYLEKLKDSLLSNNFEESKKNILSILSMTLSTSERINDYEIIYKKIFEVTSLPNTIVDLGCGFNPISFSFMNLAKINYYAYDIDKEDIDFLNKYFEVLKSKGIEGHAKILNARRLEEIKNIPSSDIIFIFKLIDILETKNNKKQKNISEELIKILIQKTSFIVASFSTKTITRKKMNYPKRKGFELMLERLGLKFTSFLTDNEVFYIIYK